MGTKYKWGVLGCAAIAENRFLPAMMMSETAELYAVASRNVEKAERFKAKFGFAKLYASYDELLDDEDVQIVYIPLPNGMHKEWVVKAANKGKHVLCEKPLCLSAKECEEIIEAGKRNRVVIMEAFMFRFSDRMRKVNAILESGEIGEVRHVYSSFGFLQSNPADYRLLPEMGGGAVYDVGSYTLNFIGMVMKENPIKVVPNIISKNGIDVTTSIFMQYASGATCVINCWFDSFIRRYSEINGTRGHIEIPDTFWGDSINMFVVTAEGRREVEINEDYNRYLAEAQNVEQAAFNGAPLTIPLEETLRNYRVIDEVVKLCKQ